MFFFFFYEFWTKNLLKKKKMMVHELDVRLLEWNLIHNPKNMQAKSENNVLFIANSSKCGFSSLKAKRNIPTRVYYNLKLIVKVGRQVGLHILTRSGRLPKPTSATWQHFFGYLRATDVAFICRLLWPCCWDNNGVKTYQLPNIFPHEHRPTQTQL